MITRIQDIEESSNLTHFFPFTLASMYRYAFIVCFLAACDCQRDVELPLAIGKEFVGRALFCAIGMIVCIYS
jgi:hypothetical protein